MRLIDVECQGTGYDTDGRECLIVRVSIGALRFNLYLSERTQIDLVRLMSGQKGASVAVPIPGYAFHLGLPKGCKVLTPETLNVRKVG